MSDVVQTAITEFGGIGKAQARAQIDRWLNEYADGTSNRRAEAVGLAQQAELDAGVVEARFAGADKLRVATMAAMPGKIFSARVQPKEEEAKPAEDAWYRKRAEIAARLNGVGQVDAALNVSGKGPDANASGKARPKDAPKEEPEPEPEPEAEVEPEGEGAAQDATLQGYLGKHHWIAQSYSPQPSFINAVL